MSRWLAYLLGAGVVAAVISPLLRVPPQDSFPLLTYPMFTTKRDKPTLYFVRGIRAQGTPLRLPPSFVANTEVMQAAASVRRAVAAGEATSRELCERVALRAAESSDHREVTDIEIVEAKFDPIDYFLRSREAQ